MDLLEPRQYIDLPESECSLHTRAPIRRGKYGRLVTFFASVKNHGPMACETLLEADFCLYLERWHQINSYQAQPFTLRLADENICYTPDFLALCGAKNTVVIYEVKSRTGATDSVWLRRRATLENFFDAHQITFRVVEEDDIRPNGVIINLRYLYHVGYDGTSHSDEVVRKVVQQLPDQHSTIAYLVQIGVAEQAIAHALFHDCIQVDLHRPIQRNSRIWIAP